MLPKYFALDTETGIVGTFKDPIRTVLIQICPMDAMSPSDVRMYCGEDCYEQFFDEFDNMPYGSLHCDVFNLDYEWAWMQSHVINRYEFVGDKPDKGQWTCLEDPMTIYDIKIKNKHGCMLTFMDLSKKGSYEDMKDAGMLVRESKPEWFEHVKGEVKEDEKVKNLHNIWWTFPQCSYTFRTYWHYAKLDAFTEAMVMRYQRDVLLNGSLTKASHGLKSALKKRYKYEVDKFNKKAFKRRYPPLNEEMQYIVEDNMVGGFVYAKPGVYKGVFCHIDYSSSYPKYYAYGELFCGKVTTGQFDRLEDNRFRRWVIVSFTVEEPTEFGLPMLQHDEETAFDYMEIANGQGSKKITSGRIYRKLMTYEYWEELQKHYYITDIVIEDVWIAKKMVGDFKEFIEYEYYWKSITDGAEKLGHKDNMNAGLHGKTITKTRRRRITYYNGVMECKEEINEPDLCALIGFTAMMNRRMALLRDCRRLQEAGYIVYYCDTDSIVVGASQEQVMGVLGDEIAFGKPTCPEEVKDHLGKFEFEGNKYNNKKIEFDEFRCWGLKRYLELDNGEYRKSAFAGMKDKKNYDDDLNNSIQYKTLMTAPVDGSEFVYTQNGSRTLFDENHNIIGKIIEKVEKRGKMESIWYMPKYTGKRLEDYVYGLNPLDYVAMEDVDAELIDKGYKDKDKNIMRKGAKKRVLAYMKEKNEEYKMREEDGYR